MEYSKDMHPDAIQFLGIYSMIMNYGKEVSPRGLLIKEIENGHYVLPPYVRFANFRARKLSLKYIKHELAWYLKGDRFDTSITNHAKLWKTLICKDGGINSNYGQYVNTQFDTVISTLKNDKDSRRASIMILSSMHILDPDAPEIPCTYSLNFRIRDNKLKMTVHMRSQDAIFGMGNDAPAFSVIQEMIFVTLKYTYPELEMGEYCHFADSLHIYERHFAMTKQILEDAISDPTSYSEVNCPRISSIDEVNFMRTTDLREIDSKINIDTIPIEYQFVRWLLTE